MARDCIDIKEFFFCFGQPCCSPFMFPSKLLSIWSNLVTFQSQQYFVPYSLPVNWTFLLNRSFIDSRSLSPVNLGSIQSIDKISTSRILSHKMHFATTSLLVVLWTIKLTPIYCPPVMDPLSKLSKGEHQLVERCYYDQDWKTDPTNSCYLITNSNTQATPNLQNMRLVYQEYVRNEPHDRIVVQHCFDNKEHEPEIIIDAEGNAMHDPCDDVTSNAPKAWTSRRQTNRRNYYQQLLSEHVAKSSRMIQQMRNSTVPTVTQTTTLGPDVIIPQKWANGLWEGTVNWQLCTNPIQASKPLPSNSHCSHSGHHN